MRGGLNCTAQCKEELTVIISTNVSAINAHRQWGTNQTTLRNSMEKLSSGLRINRAGDDAAGLAISEKMRSQIKGLEQASRNGQDGISLIQTAEGALSETHSILQRMRELAIQAANDTNADTDRKAIQKEISALTSEINRIGNTIEFNTQKLLQGGVEIIGEITAASIPPELGDPDVNGALSFTIIHPLATGETLQVGGQTITAYADELTWSEADNPYGIHAGQTAEEQADAIRHMNFPDLYTRGATNNVILIQTEAGKGVVTSASLIANVGVITEIYQQDSARGTPSVPGTSEFIINTALDTGEILRVGGQTITTYADETALNEANNLYGIHAGQTAEEQAGAIREMTFADLHVTGTSNNVTLTQVQAGVGNINEATVSAYGRKEETGFTAIFQIGANSGQTMKIHIADMRAEALGLAGETETMTRTGASIQPLLGKNTIAHAIFTPDVTVSNDEFGANTQRALSVSSYEAASAAVKTINTAIEAVSAQRSELGAYQNRLEYTISNVNHSSENLSIAESRIRDVDMAKEMMEVVKNNILSQAFQSMLAQANQQPQDVLQLLG